MQIMVCYISLKIKRSIRAEMQICRAEKKAGE